jgi:hypothetical protein
MRTTDHDEMQLQGTAADPQSQPLPNVPLTQDEESDDPDVIFIRAVVEIDTQPLPRRKRTETITITNVLQTVFCVSLIGIGLFGIVWQAITYPHTLVVLYTKAKPASITTMLDLRTRMLEPVTITRSTTTQTSGYGHQNAAQATGTLIFYNGSATPQYVPSGSMFTGKDGVKVTTEQSITVPAANLPAIGSLPVLASAMLSGSQGNIAAFDVDMVLSPVLKVRNEASFTNGRDARSYRAVAPQDLTTLTETVNKTVIQAFTMAFPLQQGEKAIPTQCHTTTSANHQIGQEAQNVTVITSKTCSAVTYNSQQLNRQATAAFTQTKSAATYHLVESVQTTLRSVAPLSVTISGKWVYTFSQDYQQYLAQEIAGDSPAKAKAYLLKTGVISYASIQSILPPATYINFLVLVG